MITSRRKSVASVLMAALVSVSLAPAHAVGKPDGGTDGQQIISQMLDQNRSNARNAAILQIARRTSPSDVKNAVDVLESYVDGHPDDRYAEMYYGYGLLFLATDYLHSKNYMKAAELSKQGFFYIDEAAESSPDDWRLRYLRTRMDAFVPAANGRCVVALKDIDFMTQSGNVPQSLDAMIVMMRERSQTSCSIARSTMNGAAPEQIKKSSGDEVPFLTAPEINEVLRVAVGGGV